MKSRSYRHAGCAHLVTWVTAIALVGLCSHVLAQEQGVRGVVVDQTGLPLPGVRVELHRRDQVVVSVTTGLDGAFELPQALESDNVEAALDGFETTSVHAPEARRIVLAIAHATETTEVVASSLTSAGAAMEHLGTTMTAPLAQRLPMARPRILQSLPLLPGVVRGADGLLRIGGARPHESSLWIDGFDVTDPVSGTSAIDLPVESVKGMAVLRDPVSATFGNVLGSLASIETTPGADQFRAGIQGFIPRPRLSHLGLGRIEAFFPRAYVGGRAGIARYFVSTEFNFERVPVPGVTGTSGQPNIGTTGVTSFARVDLQTSTRHSITLEGLYLPSTTTHSGLSTLIQADSAPNVRAVDISGGVIDRFVLTPVDLVTVRIGLASHGTVVGAQGVGDAILSPDGWSQNWFSSVDTWGTRRSLAINWDRAGIVAFGSHTVSVAAELRRRAMTGRLTHQSIHVTDSTGSITRLIEFGQTGGLRRAETFEGLGARDLWDIGPRLQFDFGVRLDWRSALSGLAPGPRAGVRYSLDDAGVTVIKASIGRFVGRDPLGALVFDQFATRTDTFFDPATGTMLGTVVLRPAITTMALPRADGMAVEIERQLGHGLEIQVGARQHRGVYLPTVEVPALAIGSAGTALLAGTGESLYRELQVSARKTWHDGSQLFLSYVRSSSTGNTNDFGSLFTNLDAPLLEPGGQAPTSADVPHRFRGWATFSLPRQIVFSPSVDWRTGFAYSAQDVYRHFTGPLNGLRFPTYFSADVTTFKTFDVLARKMDLGLQFFNITGHFNPRDVISVVDSPRYQQFTSSFGVTLTGYMQVRWQ